MLAPLPSLFYTIFTHLQVRGQAEGQTMGWNRGFNR